MRRTRTITLVDQVLANASNALFTFLVAGAASAAAFGRFAVGYAALTFAVGAWRSGLSYQVSLKAGDLTAVHRESNRAVAASILAAPALALLVFAVAGIGSHADSTLALGLALGTPLVLTQDLLRYSAVAARNARAALVSDGVWTLFLIIAVALRLANQLSTGWLVGLWAVGALTATIILAKALRTRPRFTRLSDWLKDSWRTRTHLLGAGLVSGASVPIATGLTAAIAGPEVTGAVTGAGQLMAPVNSLVAWLSLTLLAQAAAAGPARRTSVFVRAGVASAALALAWGLALLALPPTIGSALLGNTWPNVAHVLPIIGIQYTLSVLAATGDLFLMSAHRTRRVLANGIVKAGARLVLWLTSAAAFGTPLAAAIAETLTNGVWLGSALRFSVQAVRQEPPAAASPLE